MEWVNFPSIDAVKVSLRTALFYVLLGSGLRESEVVTLDVWQYQQKGLREVLRHKSKRISQKIPLPQESREFLEQYLEKRLAQEDEPLFLTRYGTRLQTLDVYRTFQRVLKQALAFLPEGVYASYVTAYFFKEGDRQAWSALCSGTKRECFN